MRPWLPQKMKHDLDSVIRVRREKLSPAPMKSGESCSPQRKQIPETSSKVESKGVVRQKGLGTRRIPVRFQNEGLPQGLDRNFL